MLIEQKRTDSDSRVPGQVDEMMETCETTTLSKLAEAFDIAIGRSHLITFLHSRTMWEFRLCQEI